MGAGHQEVQIECLAHGDSLPDPFDPGAGVLCGQRPAVVDRTHRNEQREPVPLRDLQQGFSHLPDRQGLPAQTMDGCAPVQRNHQRKGMVGLPRIGQHLANLRQGAIRVADVPARLRQHGPAQGCIVVAEEQGLVQTLCGTQAGLRRQGRVFAGRGEGPCSEKDLATHGVGPAR